MTGVANCLEIGDDVKVQIARLRKEAEKLNKLLGVQ